MARIRLEHDKAISEAQKFRKEYARSCTIDNGEKNMQGIGDNQLMALMTFQMNVLLKKATRAEQELKGIKDKYELEINQEKEKNAQKEKIIV